jgi:MoxR-like ATPase
MIAMTLAFAVAGITQVYLERRMGMDFLVVQKEIEVHFMGLILAASLFTWASALFIYNFIRHGMPEGEVLPLDAQRRHARRAGRPRPHRGGRVSTPRPKPYYRRTVHHEVEVFRHAWAHRLPVLLKGPTGCGKSRFVEAMAAELGRPLVTVACNDETSSADLLGRWIVRGGETVWQDGPVTRAVREGAVLYLDEVAEAREDVIVVVHPLSDHRRQLFVDRRDEVIEAPRSSCWW